MKDRLTPCIVSFSGGWVFREITEEEFSLLSSSARVIVAATDLEEIFSVAIESFSEIERFIFGEALDELLAGTIDGLEDLRIKSYGRRAKANSKVLAFLSAAKAYEDQAPEILCRISGETAKRRAMKSMRELEARSFSVRLSKAIRNLSQHVSLPITSHTTKRQLETPEIGDYSITRSRISIELHFERQRLIEDGVLCRSATRRVLDELSGFTEEKIDVRFLIAKYLSELAKMHALAREDTESDFQSAASAILEIPTKYLRDLQHKGQILLSRGRNLEGVERAVDKSILQGATRQRARHRQFEKLYKNYVGMAHYQSNVPVLFVDSSDTWIPIR